MSDYISREAAMEIVKRTSGDYAAAFSEIRKLPDADVEPVRHGRKIEDGDIGCFWLCSLCGKCLPYGANYCPSCGAKMDLEDDNGT